MAAGAGEMMFRCVLNGSLSMCDVNIERRPYHKNCTCALHDLKGICSHAGSQQRNVSFTERKFQRNSLLSVSTSIISSQSSRVESVLSRSGMCITEVKENCN